MLSRARLNIYIDLNPFLGNDVALPRVRQGATYFRWKGPLHFNSPRICWLLKFSQKIVLCSLLHGKQTSHTSAIGDRVSLRFAWTTTFFLGRRKWQLLWESLTRSRKQRDPSRTVATQFRRSHIFLNFKLPRWLNDIFVYGFQSCLYQHVAPCFHVFLFCLKIVIKIRLKSEETITHDPNALSIFDIHVLIKQSRANRQSK